MKPVPRKLGDPIPVRLLLNSDGTLSMADGSDPAAYLKAVRRFWIKRGLAEARTPVAVCISTNVAMEQIERDATLYRSYGA